MSLTEFNPVPGACLELEPGLRLVLAPNPSPMTHLGTNTYLLGEGEVIVIDPGPDMAVHAKAILDALRPGERLGAILVTHAHLDHSPLARVLAAQTGAAVYAYGDAASGRSATMEALAAQGLTGGGEGVDRAFAPDIRVQDGERLGVAGQELTALWTPGHFGNHMCFAWRDMLFSGDIVMGWASTMISPPDGDLTAFMASTERLAAWPARRFFPGHGAPITDPQARCRALLTHRRDRETAILAQLRAGASTIPELTRRIYRDTDPGLLGAAQRNVFAHLIDLTRRGAITAHPDLSVTARFEPG